MADNGPLGGFAEGLQGGLAAGSRLNANAIQERDSGIKSILSARNLQIEEAKNAQGVKSKDQERAIKVIDEIVGLVKTAYAEGNPAKIESADKQVAGMLTPVDPGNGVALSPADVFDQAAGRAPGTTAQQLKIIQSVQPGITDKGYGAQVVSEGTTTGSINANLAQAPAINAAAGDKAGAERTATVKADLALAPQVAAAAASQAGQVTTAQQTATVSPLAKLQADRKLAADRGDTRAVSEIDSAIAAQGASQSYDPRAATTATNAEIRKSVQDLSGSLSAWTELTSMQKMFEDTPNASGAIGAAYETFGGIVQQIGNIVGADLKLPGNEEVIAARTQARLVVDSMLRAIGQSDRASNQDRQRAQNIVKALDKDASAQQVYAAAQTALELMNREMAAQADRVLAGVDVLSAEGVEKAGEALRKNGMPSSQIPRVIAAVRARRK